MKYFYTFFAVLSCLLLLFYPFYTREPASNSDTYLISLQIQHQRNIEHHERVALIKFFQAHHTVSPYPITAYINAAAENNLDYRLLPAISIQESQGGIHACGNNWWGWDSCKGDNFGSVAEGIQYVTGQLESRVHYRGKTTDQKLRAYNPNPAYAEKVEQLMKEIQ